MKLLHYALGFPPYRSGGLTKLCVDLMAQQAEEGHTVAMLWPGQMRFVNQEVAIKKHENVKLSGKDILSFEVINNKTGGTELAHQLVYTICKLGGNAEITYYGDKNTQKEINPAFMRSNVRKSLANRRTLKNRQSLWWAATSMRNLSRGTPKSNGGAIVRSFLLSLSNVCLYA